MHFADVANIQEIAGSEDIGFGGRILLTLEQQRRSKSWLAEQIGISKQAINYLLKYSSNPKYVNEIATALEVRPEWLLFGKGGRQSLSEEVADIARIPILSLDNIPLFTKNHSHNLTDEFTHITSSSASSCFATVLENSCMEPLFNRGTLLIFNSSSEPKNGDYVIFTLAKNKELLFRQYFKDGKDIYLKAIDALYESYKGTQVTIFGVLIESRNHFK